LSKKLEPKKDSAEFYEITLNRAKINKIEPTPKKNSVIIYYNNVPIIFSKRAFAHLLRHVNLPVLQTKKIYKETPEPIINQILKYLEGAKLKVGIVKKGDKFYAYRVTTTRYTSIPHRVLFEFIDKINSNYKIKVYEKQPIKFTRRFGFFYVLGYGNIGKEKIKYGILITNSNIGNKAIHITPIARFSDGGFIFLDETVAIPAKHVGDVNQLLQRVGEKYREAVNKLQSNHRNIFKKLNTKLNKPITQKEINEFLKYIERKFAKKYHNWIRNVLYKNIEEYGPTELALVRTLAFFANVTYKKPSVQKEFADLLRDVINSPRLFFS